MSTLISVWHHYPGQAINLAFPDIHQSHRRKSRFLKDFLLTSPDDLLIPAKHPAIHVMIFEVDAFSENIVENNYAM